MHDAKCHRRAEDGPDQKDEGVHESGGHRKEERKETKADKRVEANEQAQIRETVPKKLVSDKQPHQKGEEYGVAREGGTAGIENRVGAEEPAQEKLAGHRIVGPALEHPADKGRESRQLPAIRRRLDTEPSGQHDQHAQQKQIDQQKQVIQQAIDPRQCEGVIGHAGEKEHGGHEGFRKQRLHFTEGAHAPTVRNPKRLFNEKLDSERTFRQAFSQYLPMNPSLARYASHRLTQTRAAAHRPPIHR